MSHLPVDSVIVGFSLFLPIFQIGEPLGSKTNKLSLIFVNDNF